MAWDFSTDPEYQRKLAEMIYGAEPIAALAKTVHLPEARLRDLLNVPVERPKLTSTALLGDLEARRAARRDA
jgi:hypothetical protein